MTVEEFYNLMREKDCLQWKMEWITFKMGLPCDENGILMDGWTKVVFFR